MSVTEVFKHAGNLLSLNAALNRVVAALVHGRLNPSLRAGNANEFNNLESAICELSGYPLCESKNVPPMRRSCSTQTPGCNLIGSKEQQSAV